MIMHDSNTIRAFFEQATASGSKSTVLKPLGWMMAICVSATLSAMYFVAPVWMPILFAAFSGSTMILYFIAYLYCLFRDRDALRSESYSIQKLAIEKGFVGDDSSGVLSVERQPSGKLIEDVSVEESDEDK